MSRMHVHQNTGIASQRAVCVLAPVKCSPEQARTGHSLVEFHEMSPVSACEADRQKRQAETV